jgi:16S rRNA C967 or C1407 C5-methylase (RsmB/RsmF family)
MGCEDVTMTVKLPEAFVEKMERLLGAEADALLASYKESKAQGLRANVLKLSPERLADWPHSRFRRCHGVIRASITTKGRRRASIHTMRRGCITYRSLVRCIRQRP